jgi:hypothetical protein
VPPFRTTTLLGFDGVFLRRTFLCADDVVGFLFVGDAGGSWGVVPEDSGEVGSGELFEGSVGCPKTGVAVCANGTKFSNDATKKTVARGNGFDAASGHKQIASIGANHIGFVISK